jgi:opacity protein-like surface antigen
MSHSSTHSFALPLPSRNRIALRGRAEHEGVAGLRRALCLSLALLILPSTALAQDWGEESDDGWTQSPDSESTSSGGETPTGWSFRAGLGFTDDPSSLLLNLEAPYAFDQWVSAGPMFQIGIDDNNTIVAPTLNVTVTIPDLPGEDFDLIHPFGFIGMGFAVIEDDNRRNDNSSTGFLVNFGFGVEYQLSDHFFLGTEMMFNFLPEETLDEHFFYSWQVLGARFAF